MDARDLDLLQEVRALCASGEARRRRIEARLLLSEVAEAVQTTPQTASRWERGQRSPHGAAALRYGAWLRRLERRLAAER